MTDGRHKAASEAVLPEGVAAPAEAHELQNRMMQVSRLATMGEMAAGIAHEINQPLTAIANYAKACEHFLAAGNPDLDEVRSVMREINGEALRAGDIIRRLRRLVGKQDDERVIISINELVDELRPIVLADARMHGASVHFLLESKLPQTEINRVQIQHAIINLLRNAFEAVQATPAGSREVTLNTRLASDGDIEIDVRDNGPGISPTLRERLFEPFFTTKALGSGLGLSICRTIAQTHGGTIDFHESKPTGALFRLRLPSLQGNHS